MAGFKKIKILRPRTAKSRIIQQTIEIEIDFMKKSWVIPWQI